MSKNLDLIFLLCTILIVGFQMSLPHFLGSTDRVLYQQHGHDKSEQEKPSVKEKSLPRVEIDSGVFARSFEPWPLEKPLPCLKPTKEQARRRPITPADAHNGFLFMKLMKTGGSTAAGINVRIMREAAKLSPVGKTHGFCQGRFEHCWGHEMLEGRGLDTSFAWTVIRDPTKRAVSQFFHFQVSRENVEPSDFYFQRYLASEKKVFNHYYLQVLSSKEVTPPQVTSTSAPNLINRILDEYNFIGITERMEESAVCLMMLLNLKMGTILYLNAKASGGYDDGAASSNCSFIKPSRVTRGMQSYFQKARWRAMVKWDELLYHAANRSLDLTIERLGRKEFDLNLERFRHALKVAEERCIPLEVFPCTSDGKRNANKDCLWKDSACGNSCLDRVAEDLHLW